MTQQESKNLQKYFEDEPASFFDELAPKEDSQKVSAEVRDLWPYPGKGVPTVPLVSVESLTDPITQSVTVHIPSELNKRKQAQLESLTVDDRGIKTLVDDKCYRGAIALTSRLLTNYGQGIDQKANASLKHSSHSLQLWHTRLALLVKINELEIARKEAEPFRQLHSPDMFYEHQQPQFYKSKYGTMASFSFRLFLAAELPLKLNRPVDALNNLVNILETTEKIYKFFLDLSKQHEAEFWKERKLRVMSLMIQCAMQQKNFDLAHQLYESMSLLPNLSDEFKFSLSTAWGRTFLLSGDITSAEAKFGLHQPKTPAQAVFKQIDKGLVSVAQNDYEGAFKHFQEAHEKDKDNILIINNMAVCYLYNGKMHEAIALFEKAINLNPKKSINETLLLNCATLYELESNESKKKKVELLKVISAHRADLEVGIESCLKL